MQRLIELTGSFPKEGLSFRSANLVEALSEHASAQVTLESVEPDLLVEDFLGKRMNLAFETKEDLPARHFDGVIVAMGLVGQQEGRGSLYSFELRSWTWLLSRNQDFRIYQNKTVPQIIRDVLGRQNVTGLRFDERNQGQYRVWEYCVQYAESDYAFISRLMAQEGLFFFFEHDQTGHSLVIVDSNEQLKEYPGYSSVVYNPAADSSRLTDEQLIDHLTMSKGIETPRHSHADYNFKTPSIRLLNQSTGEISSYHENFEVFEYPGTFTAADEGEAYTRLRHEAQLARQIVFKGSSRSRGLKCGSVFTPLGEAFSSLPSALLISSTSISIHEAEHEASGQGSSEFHCMFVAHPFTQPYRAARVVKKPQVKGPLPALVVGPEGEEIFTDEFGRVKVQFYWDRYGKHDEHSSCWIRVAYPVAGQGWGFVAIPRIGQEVVVSFEDGDPDRPLITGVVYNAEQKVPYVMPEHKTVSGWRTHSTLEGEADNFNELRFEDKKDNEYVWFQAEKDYFGLIKHDSQIRIRRDSHRIIDRDHYDEVGGNEFRTVEGELRKEVRQSAHLTVNDDFLAKVKGALSVINQDAMSLYTAGGLSLKSDADIQFKAASNIQLDAGSQGHFKAGSTLNISAGTSICLSVGGSSVTISAAGVSFSGPSIGVNGGGGGGSASAASPSAPDQAAEPKLPTPPTDPFAQ